MLPKRKRLVSFAVIILGVAAISIIVIARSPGRYAKGESGSLTPVLNQGTKRTIRQRNLRLQPEAGAMAQRLGRRFSAEKNERSTIDGVITLDGEQRAIRIDRKQKSNGERVEIHISGGAGALSWDS